MLLLLAVAVATAQDPPAASQETPAASVSDQDWAIATSRVLGAAGTVRDRAWQLQRTTDAILEEGRASRLNALAHDGKGLRQAVVSATLAVEVLGEKAASAEAPAAAPQDPAGD